MTALALAVSFEHRSHLIEDRCVNTWAFLTPTLAYTESEAIDCTVWLKDFYVTVHAGQVQPVADYISGCIDRTPNIHEVAVYDLTGHLDGTAHGSPVLRLPFDIPAVDPSIPSPLPSEMAVCLSYYSAYNADPEFLGSTRPRARDRGRVYIGPVNALTMSQSANGVPQVSTQCRSDIGLAAKFLADAAGAQWAQWSRKNATVEPVVGGWVDNAYDVQRRRRGGLCNAHNAVAIWITAMAAAPITLLYSSPVMCAGSTAERPKLRQHGCNSPARASVRRSKALAGRPMGNHTGGLASEPLRLGEQSSTDGHAAAGRAAASPPASVLPADRLDVAPVGKRLRVQRDPEARRIYATRPRPLARLPQGRGLGSNRNSKGEGLWLRGQSLSR